MGYDLHITRRADWTSPGDDITAEEWLAYVAQDEELELAPENGPHFVLWRGKSKYDDPWLDWRDGNVYSKNPDQPLIDKMVAVAQVFGAQVQGDDGELYGDDPNIERTPRVSLFRRFCNEIGHLLSSRGQKVVNGSAPPIPEIFLCALKQGRWVHPGDDVMLRVVSCIECPLEFLDTIEWVKRESCGHLADYPNTSQQFKEVRGSRMNTPVELPWRDVEQSILIAINRDIGYDVAIALDFRTCTEDPRVIASAWRPHPGGIDWVEIAPTFSAFLKLLGIES